MKRKYGMLLLGVVLGISLLGGCSGAGTETGNTTEVATEANAEGAGNGAGWQLDENAIYGEVSAVGEQSITIQVGTLQMGNMQERGERPDGEMPERPEGESAGNGEAPDFEKGEMPGRGGRSMLELTGEEQEISVTSDTVITRMSMGGFGGGMRRENSENSEFQEMSGDSERPQRPQSVEAQGNGGERPQMETEEITLHDISEGDTVTVVLDESGNAEQINVMSMGRGSSMGEAPGGIAPGVGEMAPASEPESYTAVTEYSEDTEIDGERFDSTGADENAIHVLGGAKVTMNDINVSRISADSQGGDTSSFYGVGAAILTTDGTAVINDSSIDADAAGGAGVFAYGNGTVYISDSEIRTEKDASGGIHAAGGGTLYAWDLDVETNGESSAAIRSDRGGGKMVVDEGEYVSNGISSPAVYSTADIAIHDAELTANSSEAVCIEGLNSLRLYDVELRGNMSDDERNDCTWNVILYQSMSGDSKIGNSTFEMSGGTLTAENGGMFYTTNTESTFTLSEVELTKVEEDAFFLQCTGNTNQRGWGTAGANGADCLFTAIKQEMQGDVIWDSISKLDFYMTEGSRLKGAVVNDETYAGEGGDGYCNLYLDADSTWIVTGDSTVSALYCEGEIVDENGDSATIKGNDGTVYVEGNGSYTVTVDTYEESADVSGASTTTDWSEYETAKQE